MPRPDLIPEAVVLLVLVGLALAWTYAERTTRRREGKR